MAGEFFSNRELYDIIQEVKEEMIQLKTEMRETRTIIRDYNGLRKKIDETEDRVSKVETASTTTRWLTGIGLTIMGLIIAILNYIRG